MKLAKLLNPKYVYQRRHRIRPYLRYQSKKPLRYFQRFAVSHGYPVTASDKKLAALKDKHKGQRCFIIGNGPSLQINDLKKLSQEITFASNKIYLIFDKIEWRPTYYSVEDQTLARRDWDTLNNLNGFTKLFPDNLDLYVPRYKDGIYYYLKWEKPGVQEFNYPSPPKFSTNALLCVYAGCTISFVLIQLAWFMGIREIYLIGMDFNYIIPEKVGREGDTFISEGQEINHFLPNYYKSGDLWSLPRVYMMEKAMESAHLMAQREGTIISNATRGGKLEVFPRVDFDALF